MKRTWWIGAIVGALWGAQGAWGGVDANAQAPAGRNASRGQSVHPTQPSDSVRLPAHWLKAVEILNKAYAAGKQAGTTDHFYELARLFAKAGQFTQAFQVVQEIRDTEPRVWALREIAVAQAKAGQTPQARQTFQQAIQTAKELEKEYEKRYISSDLSDSEKENLKKYYRDMELWELVEKMAEVGELELALQTVREIEQEYQRNMALGAVALAQARAGQFEKAIETVEQIHPTDRRGWYLVSIVSIQAESGLFEQALQTAQKIVEARWRMMALRTIATAQAKSGQLAPALQTLRKIENRAECASALQEIADIQLEQALRALAQAFRTARWIGNHERQTAILRVIATTYAKIGRFERAREVAREIRDADQRAQTLHIIAEAQKEQARAFRQALQSKQGIEQVERGVEKLWQLVQSKEKPDAYEQALEQALGIAEPQKRASALLALVNAEAESGQYGRAVEVAQKIEQSIERAEAWCRIAELQVEQAQKAIELTLLEGQNWLGTDWGNRRFLPAVATTQAKLGRFGRAVQIAQAIQDAFARITALCAIAERQVELGDREKAKQTLEHAVQSVPEIGEVSLRIETLASISAKQMRIGEREAAQRTLDQLIQMARTIEDVEERDFAFTFALRQYIREGQLETALQLAQETQDKLSRNIALYEVLDAQVEAGQFTQALQTVQEISDQGGYHLSALQKIALGYAKLGRVEMALQMVEQMRRYLIEKGRLSNDGSAYPQYHYFRSLLEISAVLLGEEVR